MDVTPTFERRVSAETGQWPTLCRHFVVKLPVNDPDRGRFKVRLDQYRLNVERILQQWEVHVSQAHQDEALRWLHACTGLLEHLSKHPTPQQMLDPVGWAGRSLVSRARYLSSLQHAEQIIILGTARVVRASAVPNGERRFGDPHAVGSACARSPNLEAIVVLASRQSLPFRATPSPIPAEPSSRVRATAAGSASARLSRSRRDGRCETLLPH